MLLFVDRGMHDGIAAGAWAYIYINKLLQHIFIDILINRLNGNNTIQYYSIILLQLLPLTK